MSIFFIKGCEKVFKDIKKQGCDFSIVEKKAKEKGVSLFTVAKEVGFASLSTLYDWKAGRYTPKIDKLIKLAEYFGCDVMDFYKKG